MRRLFLALTLLSWLSGCGENPPVPVDHFYQLNINSASVPSVNITDGVIYVEGIRADGIYNERALLYSEDGNRQELQQYHYHFWALPPATLLREHLVAYLRQAGAAPTVISDYRSGDGVGISGRLLGFEKLAGTDSSETSVHVAMELRIDAPGQELPVLLRNYESEQPVSDSSMSALVAAFNRAVDGIYAEFLADASQSLQAAR